jgi:hypothetical protein
MSTRPDAPDPAATIPIVQTLGMDQVRLLVQMLAELDDDEAAQQILAQLGECDATDAKSAV